MKSVFIKTYGCQMNEYDSSRMLDLLKASHDIDKTDDINSADILLLNTCSIREKAEDKVYSELGRWRELKEQRPGLIIGVAGCVASQEGDVIRQRAPYVDLVFGPQTLHRLPNMLNELKLNHKTVVDVSFHAIEKFDNLPAPRADGPTAFVSIMEGCSKYCSYCIVPYTRGEEINRNLDDIVLEVSQLAAQGVKEITLLGQNVNAYRGPMHDGQIADLAVLISYINEMDGIERIRFTTSHPMEFSERLIQSYAQTPKLANHLHLPLQSGSDRILNMMKRGHTALEYKSKIRHLRAARPDICISSDFIVGFPGETDADFQATLDLVREINFDLSFSFIYSQRPGTPASNYPDDVSMEVKKQRLQILQAQLNQQGRLISQNMLHTQQDILIIGPSWDNPKTLAGRTENNRIVHVSAPDSLLGKMARVKISAVAANRLVGELSV